MTSRAFFSLCVALGWVSLATSARAQGTVVVVPWTVGAGDAASIARTAESVSLAIPASVGSVVSVSETRTRFELRGSSDAPTVTSAELEQWTAFSRQAVRDLANEDYVAAREALRHAQEISDRAAAEMSREEARARQVLDTCLFGVRAYVEQSDPHAEEQMLGCRRLVPRIAPSANIHTPEVVELLGRIDRRLAAAHRGPLLVESQPAACTLRLNGIALGQTPFTSEQLAPGEYRVQVECGDSGHGRLHRVTVSDESGPVTLRIDARFDRVVRTDGVLRLAYADGADADAHRVADAAAIGAALEASEVWLVGIAADGSLTGDRVRVSDGSSTGTTGATATTSSTALVTTLMAAPAPEIVQPTDGGGEIQPGTWALLIGGAAVAIAGGVMIGVGAGDLNAVGMPRVGEGLNESAARQRTGEAIVGTGAALLGVGLVVGGIGIALAVSDTSQHTAGSARLHLRPLGAELTIEF